MANLEKEGFWPLAAHSVGGRETWILRLRVPETIRNRFGLARELLLMALAGEVRLLDLERGERELHRNGGQVESELMLVADGRPELENRLLGLPGERGRWIPLPVDEELAVQFHRLLPSFDVFDRHTPVRLGSVFGRHQEIEDLSARVLAGEAVGVFGLRKIGKSTAVRAVTDRLDPFTSPAWAPGDETTDVRAFVAWVDVQAVRREHIRDTYRMISQEIFQRARRSDLDVELPEPSAEGLHDLLNAVLDLCCQPLCLVIDECDYLFAGEEGASHIPGVGSLLGVLRAVSQTRGRLSVVLIGRNHEVSQVPLLDGLPNPFLAWFRARWLGPLSKKAADDLLVTLGMRIGLSVADSTCALARRWTGGHAFLHRQFGSALHEAAAGRGQRDAADTAELEEHAVDIFEERLEVESVAAETIQLLRAHFPPALNLLLELAHREPNDENLDALGGWRSPGARTLRRLGLLTRAESGALFIPELLLVHVRWLPRDSLARAG